MFVQQTGGVVKNGVIVPDRPLPEDAYVEIAVPNAPREIVERVRERELGGQTRPEPSGVVIGPDVEAFLRYHDAEKGFAALRQLLGECFPEADQLTVWLEEDREASGWIHVVCEAAFPKGYPLDRHEKQREEFYRRRGGAIPAGKLSLFVNLFDFA